MYKESKVGNDYSQKPNDRYIITFNRRMIVLNNKIITANKTLKNYNKIYKIRRQVFKKIYISMDSNNLDNHKYG